jgi:signal transduction histidine kinase
MGIVQEHGGKIDIESEWMKGTSFQISLPKNNPNLS